MRQADMMAWSLGAAALVVATWGMDGMLVVCAACGCAAWCRGVCAMMARL